MRYFFIVIVLLFTTQLFSQVRIGYELGGGIMQNLNSISYTDKTLSYNGDIGINLEIPVIKDKLSFETGVLFYDTYYRVRGPYVKIMITETRWSGFKLTTEVNDFGIKVPFRIIANTGKISPFIGAGFYKSFSETRILDRGLYSFSAPAEDIYSKGNYVIELYHFTWNLCGGLYYKPSPTVKFRLQYSLGMNDFVSHTFTTRIINDVVIDPPFTETTRMQQLQIAMVYTPNWKKVKQPLKERIKTLYQ